MRSSTPIPPLAVRRELKRRGYKLEPHCWNIVTPCSEAMRSIFGDNLEVPAPQRWTAFAKNADGVSVELNVFVAFSINEQAYSWGVEEMMMRRRIEIELNVKTQKETM